MQIAIRANLLARRIYGIVRPNAREQVRSYRVVGVRVPWPNTNFCRSQLVGETVLRACQAQRFANKFAPTGLSVFVQAIDSTLVGADEQREAAKRCT